MTNDCVAKMLNLFLKIGAGGKKVMTVLLIRKNVDNYGHLMDSPLV